MITVSGVSSMKVWATTGATKMAESSTAETRVVFISFLLPRTGALAARTPQIPRRWRRLRGFASPFRAISLRIAAMKKGEAQSASPSLHAADFLPSEGVPQVHIHRHCTASLRLGHSHHVGSRHSRRDNVVALVREQAGRNGNTDSTRSLNFGQT